MSASAPLAHAPHRAQAIALDTLGAGLHRDDCTVVDCTVARPPRPARDRAFDGRGRLLEGPKIDLGLPTCVFIRGIDQPMVTEAIAEGLELRLVVVAYEVHRQSADAPA